MKGSTYYSMLIIFFTIVGYSGIGDVDKPPMLYACLAAVIFSMIATVYYMIKEHKERNRKPL